MSGHKRPQNKYALAYLPSKVREQDMEAWASSRKGMPRLSNKVCGSTLPLFWDQNGRDPQSSRSEPSPSLPVSDHDSDSSKNKMKPYASRYCTL